MFSCEFSEISKNTFSLEHLWTTASEQFYTDTPTNEKNWVEKLKIDHSNIM